MKGYLTYFFEQHKRLILGYSVSLVIAMILSLSLKTTTAPVCGCGADVPRRRGVLRERVEGVRGRDGVGREGVTGGGTEPGDSASRDEGGRVRKLSGGVVAFRVWGPAVGGVSGEEKGDLWGGGNTF